MRWKGLVIISVNGPQIIWMTGLSGAGKTTLAYAFQDVLKQNNIPVVVLDGDEIRQELSRDLGFSSADRKENLRRIAAVAKILLSQGINVIVATIAPYRLDRYKIEQLFHSNYFTWVYVKCSLEECKRRDVKGLYDQVRLGLIDDFTGIQQSYEIPNGYLTIDTEETKLGTGVLDLLHAFINKTHR